MTNNSRPAESTPRYLVIDRGTDEAFGTTYFGSWAKALRERNRLALSHGKETALGVGEIDAAGKITDVTDVTDLEIEALETESAQVHDFVQVGFCRIALTGSFESDRGSRGSLNLTDSERARLRNTSRLTARGECAEAIYAARDMAGS